MSVTFDDIEKAQARIKLFVHRTLLLSSRIIKQRVGADLGADLYFNCENFHNDRAVNTVFFPLLPAPTFQQTTFLSGI